MIRHIKKHLMKKMIKFMNMIKKEIGLPRIVVRITRIKRVVALTVVVVVAMTIVVLKNNFFQQQNKTITYQLENTTYRLLVADTPKQWEKGLMYIKKKEDFDGMIFYFPEKEYRSFWNKNTLVDLGVYWLIDNKVIGKETLFAITKNGPQTVSSLQPVNRVIEIIR